MILRLIEPGATEQDTTRRLAARSELLLLDPKETVILDEVIEALQDNGTASLRGAIENAPAGSTITFDASLQYARQLAIDGPSRISVVTQIDCQEEVMLSSISFA